MVCNVCLKKKEQEVSANNKKNLIKRRKKIRWFYCCDIKSLSLSLKRSFRIFSSHSSDESTQKMKHLLLFTIVVHVVMISSLDDFFGSVVIPSDVSITLDESIYIKMKTPIQGQTKCEYQAPGKKERNFRDFFVQFTDDKCGIKIARVQKSHEGVWKLISTYKNASFETSIKGTSLVRVKDKIVVPQQEKRVFSPTDNFTPENVDLNYCYVSKEAGMVSKMTEIDTQKCMIPQDIDNDDFQNGEWSVRVGVKGVTKEISFSVIIQATGEMKL